MRIDADSNVWTLAGVKIGGPEMAELIIAGFEHATPMRSTEEILSGTGIKVRGKAS